MSAIPQGFGDEAEGPLSVRAWRASGAAWSWLFRVCLRRSSHQARRGNRAKEPGASKTSKSGLRVVRLRRWACSCARSDGVHRPQGDDPRYRDPFILRRQHHSHWPDRSGESEDLPSTESLAQREVALTIEAWPRGCLIEGTSADHCETGLSLSVASYSRT